MGQTNRFVSQIRIVLSLIAISFGIATLKEGGSLLFIGGDAQESAGNYIPFIVWFNFFAGFLYVATGFGIWRSRQWARGMAATVAGGTLVVFALLAADIALGRPYEFRTVLAMALRSVVWSGIALLLYDKRPRKCLSVGFLVVAALIHSPSVLASKSELAEMPEALSIGETQLHLNGKVVHKVTFLSINVFVAGFYLEARSRVYSELAKSPGLKHVRIRFLRSVGKDRLAKTWKKQLHESCQRQCDKLQPSLVTRLGDAFEDLTSGDLLEFTIYPDRLSISVNGRLKDSIPSVPMAEVMLDAWIGPKPIADDVKSALLGQQD